MATNIEMNLLKDNGSYEVLYPKTDWDNIENKPTTSVTTISTITKTDLNNTYPIKTMNIVNKKIASTDISFVYDSDIRIQQITNDNFYNTFYDIKYYSGNMNSGVSYYVIIPDIFKRTITYSSYCTGIEKYSSATTFEAGWGTDSCDVMIKNDVYFTVSDGNIIIKLVPDVNITYIDTWYIYFRSFYKKNSSR